MRELKEAAKQAQGRNEMERWQREKERIPKQTGYVRPGVKSRPKAPAAAAKPVTSFVMGVGSTKGSSVAANAGGRKAKERVVHISAQTDIVREALRSAGVETSSPQKAPMNASFNRTAEALAQPLVTVGRGQSVNKSTGDVFLVPNAQVDMFHQGSRRTNKDKMTTNIPETSHYLFGSTSYDSAGRVQGKTRLQNNKTGVKSQLGIFSEKKKRGEEEEKKEGAENKGTARLEARYGDVLVTVERVKHVV